MMMDNHEELVKGRPPLRENETTPSDSFYNRTVAAPSDDVLVQMWIGWSVLTFICAIFAGVLFLAILCSRTARRQSFNLYLLFLTLPDVLFGLICGITCGLNAYEGHYYSTALCNFQAYAAIVGIGSNLWMSAVITSEIHALLRYSRHRRRYFAPTRRKVTLQAFAVYGYCMALGGLVYVDHYLVDDFPFHVASPAGTACIPIVGPTTSSVLFFWLCFIPLYAGLPVLYILVVAIDIYRRKLTPPPGKRRTLTVYFGRMIVVVIVMWIPFLLVAYIIGPWAPPWLLWSGGTASHLQAVISVLIALLKPDVRRAVIEFLTCRCTCWRRHSNNDSSDLTRTNNGGRRRPSDPFDAMQSQWWNSTRTSLRIMLRSSSRASNSSVDYVDRSNDLSSRSELFLSPSVGNGEMTLTPSSSPATVSPSLSGLNGGSHRSSSSSNTAFWPSTTSSSSTTARGGNQHQNGDNNDDEEMENGRRRPSWHKHSVGAVIAEEEGVDSYEDDDDDDHATETAAFNSSSSCGSSKSPEAVANHQQQQRPPTPPPLPPQQEQQEQQEQDQQPQPQPQIDHGGID